MWRIFFLLIFSIFIVSDLYAAQSSITEADGTACMS